MIENILFDLDGTLTDPALGITNSLIYSLKAFNIEVKDRPELYCCIGPPLLERYQTMWGFSPEQSRRALDIYREYFEDKGIYENEVYNGIAELLSSLKKSGKRIYLATGKPEIYAKEILRYFDLEKYFTFAAGNSMSEDRHKKSDVIKYLMENCPEVTSKNSIMVGDREFDVQGAYECDMECIGVLYGYGSREELENAGAKYICKNVSELSELLTRL